MLFSKIKQKDIVLPFCKKSIPCDHLFYQVFFVLSLIASFFVVKGYLNFPLNDDWSYSKTVYTLVVERKFQFMDWYSMTFLTQLFWGALFCLVFGFSHAVLRISTLVLVVIGGLLLYNVLRTITKKSFLSFIITLCTVFSPIFFNLSFSFMTDVPFLMFMFFAFYYYKRYNETEKSSYYILFLAFVVLSTLSRQMGIFLPIAAFGTAFLFQFNNKRRLGMILLAVVVAVGTLTAFKHIMQHFHLLPAMYGNVDLMFKNVSFDTILMRWGLIFTFVGVLWLPFTLVYHPFGRHSRHAYWITALLLFPLAVSWGNMAIHSNYISGKCIGVLTLKDSYVLELPNTFAMTDASWLIFNILGLVGAASLFIKIVDFVDEMYAQWRGKQVQVLDKLRITAFFVNCLFVVYLVLTPYQYDRYYIPIIFFFVFVFTDPRLDFKNIWFKRAAILSVGLSAMIAIIGIHDYISWNEARWDAIHYLMKDKKVPAEKIDGGFEFNGWHFYDYKYRSNNSKSWWWVKDDEYIITFGEFPGYKMEKVFSFKRWVDYSWREMCILRRDTSKIIKRTDKHVFTLDSATIFNKQYVLAAERDMFLKASEQIDFKNTAFTGDISLLLNKKYPYAFTGSLYNIALGDRLIFNVWANRAVKDSTLPIILSASDNSFTTVIPDSVGSSRGWIHYRYDYQVKRVSYSSTFKMYFVSTGDKPIRIDDLTIEHQRIGFPIYWYPKPKEKNDN